MKKFLINVLLFLIYIFLADKLFIVIRNYTPKKEIDKRLEYLVNGKINSKILIFGSSRAARDIIANEITKKLNVSAYNLAYPGSNIDFHNFLLNQLLLNGNKKPETIVLVMDEPKEIVANSSIQFRLDRIYPLVKYKVIRDEFIEREHKSNILSGLMVINTLRLSQFDLSEKQFNVLDSLLPCGSMPISVLSNNFYKDYSTIHNEYDLKNESEYLKEKLLSFVKICLKNDIQLIIAFPPQFKVNNYHFTTRIKNLIGEKVKYLLYDTIRTEYKTKDYFYNAGHLNKKGALIYTEEVINFIRNNYNNNIK